MLVYSDPRAAWGVLKGSATVVVEYASREQTDKLQWEILISRCAVIYGHVNSMTI